MYLLDKKLPPVILYQLWERQEQLVTADVHIPYYEPKVLEFVFNFGIII